MLFSTTSSPISSRLSRTSRRIPPTAVLPSALRHPVWASDTQLDSCSWNARKSSRFSCMSRALPVWLASAREPFADRERDRRDHPFGGGDEAFACLAGELQGRGVGPRGHGR